MLAIELDGVSHAFREVRDAKRQKRIESYGITFLRFDDLDVKFHMREVLRSIENWIDEHTVTHRISAEAERPSW